MVQDVEATSDISNLSNLVENLQSTTTVGKEIMSDDMQKSMNIEYPIISFFKLFKFSTKVDKFNIIVGAIFSVISAFCTSVFALLFGGLTGSIIDYVATTTTLSLSDLEKTEADRKLWDSLVWFTWITLVIGVLIFALTYLSTVMFNYSALRQTYKIRELFFKKVLQQDIPWYDVNQTGDFASRVADDLKKIEDGIGEKVATFIYYVMIMVISILQGLIIGWELTLVCMVSSPISMLVLGCLSWISSKLSKQEMDAYGEAGAIAEETFSAIRTVVALEGEETQIRRYNELLVEAKNNNIKRSLFNAISNGVMWFFIFISYAIAFWYGIKLIEREKGYENIVYTPGNVVAIFFSVLTATWYFGTSAPFVDIFAVAKSAATKIFGIIHSEPIINASKGRGVVLNALQGDIVFKDVHFHYPSRADVKILQKLNLKIKSGETVALVGSSGCGKSTCIQLIQRFYDPTFGSISIDNCDITTMDLTWLRTKIGVVGQEPVLFEATIAENIRFGCDGASQEDVERAAQKANAHVFISALPMKYDTMIGERGAQLSGGQKQRIAIARALVRRPTILLLDEATSALDSKSEALVQEALDAASTECTTIIVAHRLSTIRNADRIIVISEGKVLEEGSHNDLIAKQGSYYQMVNIKEDLPKNKDLEQDESCPDEISSTKIKFEPQESIEIKNEGVAEHFEETQTTPEVDDEKSTLKSLGLMMKVNKPEWWVIIIGCISAIITGSGLPVCAVLFGEVIKVLAYDEPEKEINRLALFFVILGVAAGVAYFFQFYMFGIAGEKLSMRLRKMMFSSMLKQEIAWFDQPENGVGSLCARLSGEAASVQGATGPRIGTMTNTFTTITVAIGISMYFEWRITLVGLCLAPFMAVALFMDDKIMTEENEGSHKALMKSTKIAVEAISNIRTVASLNCEEKFHQMYMAELIPFQNKAKRNTHFRGLVFGLSRSLVYLAEIATLSYGTYLIWKNDVEYNAIFTVSEALITSTFALANALAFSPNFQKGVISAIRINQLLKRVPKIENGSGSANEEWEKGDIKYRKVNLCYPTRPSVNVLQGLNLAVLQGKMIALVGPSGCGKSTIVQLLERFYDPSSGVVKVDDKDTKNMNLSALRSHLGIVSQEPNLFSKTIAENIGFGDTKRTVTTDEIIQAAKNANIHNFIVSLPLGYNTKLGENGTQLSGGQKQRVAIARALIRNPKVLLLDEATSALDSESEKVVQDALDKAKQGRTCISIAHRLTTIQDADVICVINHGVAAELGTHEELLNKNGIYTNLYNIQMGIQ